MKTRLRIGSKPISKCETRALQFMILDAAMHAPWNYQYLKGFSYKKLYAIYHELDKRGAPRHLTFSMN